MATSSTQETSRLGGAGRKLNLIDVVAQSVGDYVTDGLGERVGAAAGFMYYLGVMALGGGLLVLIAGTIHDTLLAEFGFKGVPITVWAIILLGLVYGVLLFTGFETAANLGEETEHPKRDVPRAVLASVLIVGGFYLVCSYAQVAGYKFDLGAMGKNASAPLFGLAAPASAGGYGGTAMVRLLELVVVLDMIAVLTGISVASSRGIFAMARDHRFPPVLGKVSHRGTPLNAGLVVLAFFAVVVVLTRQAIGLFAVHGLPHYFAMFSWGSSFGGLALAVIYLLLCAGAVKGLREHASRVKMRTAIVVGAVVTLAAIFGAVYQVPAPTVWCAYAVAGVFVAGLVLASFALVRDD
jgi:amino acid transporter